MTKEKVQDGWIALAADDEILCWAQDLLMAVLLGLEDVEGRDAPREEPSENVGSFRIMRAYRVDLGRAGEYAAYQALDMLCDGSLETFFVQDPDLFKAMEADLCRAFAAQVERVCGPFYEALGAEYAEFIVDYADGEYGLSRGSAGFTLDGGDARATKASLALLAEIQAELDERLAELDEMLGADA